MDSFSFYSTLTSVGQAGKNYSTANFGLGITKFDVRTPKAYEFFLRLKSFRSLSDGWDGYGATSLSEEIVQLAQNAIVGFDCKGCLPNKVMPGVGEDIAMLWKREDYTVLLEISTGGWDWTVEYVNGKVLYFEIDGSTSTCIEAVYMTSLRTEEYLPFD